MAEQGLKPTDLLDGTLPPLSHTIAQNCVKKGAQVLVVCGQLSLPKGAKPRPCYWEANFNRYTKGKNHRGAEVCFPGTSEIYVVAPHLVVLLEHKPADPQAFFILAPDVEVHSDYETQEADLKSKSYTLEPEGIETLVKKAWEGEDISAHLVSLTAVSLLALARRLGLPISGKGKRRQDYLDQDFGEGQPFGEVLFTRARVHIYSSATTWYAHVHVCFYVPLLISTCLYHEKKLLVMFFLLLVVLLALFS